jgi:ferrochelatase
MTTGVLLLAYGSPENPDEVEPYFTHIRGGRPPSPESVENLRERYRRVGGRTPLLRITREVQGALEARLNCDAGPGAYRVYAGMKHWHPFTADVMRTMAGDGIRRVVAMALAPHYSRISIGGYRKGVEAGQEALGHPFQLSFVDSWHVQPEFLAVIADHVRTALAGFSHDGGGDVTTVFTAHSLPVRIREWGDPYESQLLASSDAVAKAVGLADWRFAWQSAGITGEPWLGPDILDELDSLRAEGARRVLQVPIGFVSDHLEILYDIDVEAADRAAALGIEFARTALPNASPAFIDALAAVVVGAEREAPESSEVRAERG